MRVVGAAFVRFRALVAAPAAVLALVIVACSGARDRQLAAFAVGVTLTAGFFSVEALIARRAAVTERWLFRSLMLTLVALSAACAVTGATSSPMVPLLFAPTITTFAAFGRRRETALAFVALACVMLVLAALPPGVPFDDIAQPWRRWLTAQVVVVCALLLMASVASLTDAFSRQAASLDQMRETVLEDSLARSRTLDAVGAKVAHEIKNPLTAVKGLVALLSRTQPSDRDTRRIEVIASEISRIEGIVEDWRMFSRPLEDISTIDSDVGSVLDDVASILEARAESSGVVLSTERGSGMCPHDPRRLKAALLNLASNALEATPRGGAVTLACQRRSDFIEVCVRDTGCGLDDEGLRRVGTAFYTTRDSGTGLGVLLARVVIEQHGGTLRYESAVGHGTRAVAELPLRSRQAGET